MNKDSKIFVVHVAALEVLLAEIIIHYSQVAQIISGDPMQIAVLQQDQTPINILPQYAHYTDIFSFDLVIKLPKNTSINKYAIKLKKDK